MHTLHHFAVKAEDKEEAFKIVQSNLLDEDFTKYVTNWSDWHVVGGGRWNSNGDQYKDSDTDILSYQENPVEFMQKLLLARKYQAEEMAFCLERVKFDEIKEKAEQFVEHAGQINLSAFNMNYHYVGKICDILQRHYDSWSFFYDMENSCVTDSYLINEIEEGTKNWFLVPVDFHF